VLLIVVNIAALGAFLAVQIHRPSPTPTWRDHFARERPFARIDGEKRQKVVGAMREFHEEIRGLVQETGDLEDDAIAAMGESPVPRERIDSLLVRISNNRLEIARRATDRMIEMGETLTPGERERFMSALMRTRGHRLRAPGHREEAPPPKE
jgi:uncharacterized membrane protein